MALVDPVQIKAGISDNAACCLPLELSATFQQNCDVFCIGIHLAIVVMFF